MAPPDIVETYEPPRPTLAAGGLLAVWVAILSLPMWTGKFLAGQFSDQYHSGFAFRHWLATEWKRTGDIPLWNPELFGGLPFVGAMHGDIFYPTSWLRLILPTGTAMNLGFVVHYFLAGMFAYLLLRLLRTSWSAAVTGGFAYQLSGVIGSYVQPGHDGKLFVTTLLPLALAGLVLGMRDRRWEGYGLLALSVGLALVSPHAQTTYYMLIVAGVFALYLSFGERSDGPLAARLPALGLALAAVLVGFGIGMIQILPFYHYIPFSPRAETSQGFEWATSYAVPWSHVPEFFASGFVGTSQDQTYWGGNSLKLHSEYLGLPVIALAVLGAMGRDRRRLVWWLGGIGLLFLLVSMGSATPFYRLWWSVMPFMKQVRAPGMALYVVALVLAIFAAFGVDRLRDVAPRWAMRWIVAGAAVAGLAAVGVFGAVAEAVAGNAQVGAVAHQAAGPIRLGALGSGLALALLGGLALAAAREKLGLRAVALAVPLLVSADLWRNVRGFWDYTSPPAEGLYGRDAVKDLLSDTPPPYRVLDLSDNVLGLDVYRGSSLMAFGVPQLLGHHGNELHRFDELMGGKNSWKGLEGYAFASRRLWELYGVRYVLLTAGLEEQLAQIRPAFAGLDRDYRRALDSVQTSDGGWATVYEHRDPIRYARFVPAALKVPLEQAIPTVADPRSRLEFDRLVLLDPDAPIDPAPVDTIPEPAGVAATVERWDSGRMTIRLDPAPDADGFLLVSENYYPDWRATVDEVPAPVVRGNVALITVPVPAGAREVTLEFASEEYRLGRLITFMSLVLVAAAVTVPGILRRLRA